MSRCWIPVRWWLVGLCLVGIAPWLWRITPNGLAQEKRPPSRTQLAKSESSDETEPFPPTRKRVAVIKPQSGGIPRISEQPGTMESFDFADLYSKVSGYVKVQSVDIGSRVKVGDVLVEIDAPEFEEALHEATAAVAQAEAQVVQMQARVDTAQAELNAAEANIALSEAELAKAASYLSFREIQFQRVKHLFDLKSIDERLVDEKHEQRDSAQAAENSAKAAIVAAKSQTIAARARIASARADVLDAEAKVRLAQARESRARVFVNYTKITSPYDGVVTRRSFHVGDFVRAADQGGTVPLLTVARTDLMRIIVQIPERDVPFTDVGDTATVTPNVLEGVKLQGTVARISHSEDRTTRTMRAEVDLPNPGNTLRDGMFCRVAISLDASAAGLKVPSTSVLVDRQSKKPMVYVVSEGLARRRFVQIGQDNGKMVEITSGLETTDHVVDRPARDLADKTPVDVEE